MGSILTSGESPAVSRVKPRKKQQLPNPGLGAETPHLRTRKAIQQERTMHKSILALGAGLFAAATLQLANAALAAEKGDAQGIIIIGGKNKAIGDPNTIGDPGIKGIGDPNLI